MRQPKNKYVPPSLVGEGRIPCSSGAGGVGSIPANSDAQNVPSFRRWRFEMKLSPFFFFFKHQLQVLYQRTVALPLASKLPRCVTFDLELLT
jgi:hypothetical protein